MVGINADGPSRDRVMQMMAQKDKIEAEIREHTLVLEANKVTMHESLVDEQGFPRIDIDVYKVRHSRHRIICLQNDHKAIMKRIEQGLAEFHSQFLPTQQPTVLASSSHTNGNANGTLLNGELIYTENYEGFAKINFVHEGSPADLAGLCVNDEILQFGSINPDNFTDVTQIHDIVAHSIGQNVRVLVQRNHQMLSMTVNPRPWAHPGLLGCQIVRRN